MKKVSVIIPAYNAGDYLERSIDSVLSQQGASIEIIVSDDGSEDNTEQAVAKYIGREGIVYIRNTRNCGVSVARNLGIRASTGNFIAFCDADDEWLPGKLEKQINYLSEHPEENIVFTSRENVCDNDCPECERIRNMGRRGEWYMAAALVRKSLFEQYGLFDETMRIREDTELLTRLRSGGENFGRVDEILYRRHILPTGLSVNANPNERNDRLLSSLMRGIRRNSKPNKTETELSVLIPMYNAGNYIIDAIRSVRAQGIQLEIIIIDDGSTDGCASTAWTELSSWKSQEEDGFSVLVRMAHRGQAASRNLGLSLARGKWLFFLDADDYLTEGALDALLCATKEDPKAQLISSMCEDFISPELPEEEAIKLKINPNPYRRMLAGCMLIHRELFDCLGRFDESLASSETAQWVLKLRDAGINVCEIDKLTLKRRYHMSNLGRLSRKTQLQSYMSIIKNRQHKKH
ncbi:MAG: glycosyltransferase family 2 protein [Clostridia bacterium]|nr:glycosyltransferase family 2 protein [Clostridia bacterium]MBN2883050.1 glycosyltransferase family 2 protein [Clostridia bacterium]